MGEWISYTINMLGVARSPHNYLILKSRYEALVFPSPIEKRVLTHLPIIESLTFKNDCILDGRVIPAGTVIRFANPINTADLALANLEAYSTLIPPTQLKEE